MKELLGEDTSQVYLTPSLQEEIQKLQNLHTEILSGILTSFEKGVEIGERLSKIKERLPHGQFTSFIEKNIIAFSLRTAQRYMKIYEHRDELRMKLNENLDITSAIKFLTDQKNALRKKGEKPSKTQTETRDIFADHTNKVRMATHNFLRIAKTDPERALEKLKATPEKIPLVSEGIDIKVSKSHSRKEKLERDILNLESKKLEISKEIKKKRRELKLENKEGEKLHAIQLNLF